MRDKKVQRYKDKKMIETRIKDMKMRLKEDPEALEEGDMRNFHLDYIKMWIYNTVDNLDSIESELEILKHMDGMRTGRIKPNPPPPDIKPLKPILITRDMIKNQVFGPGYRNLPTMTDEEYFQKELAEGKIVTDYEGGTGQTGERPPKEESDSDDGNDEEKLKKKRDWDDWKDTHRRGEGNKERHG